ncbi:MAG: DNA topoisomerase IV subunit B [Rhodospirillaceae bacterium]|nr:DNA topoisomerase IV subunit B [Rhodospirillaceae bacterium]
MADNLDLFAGLDESAADKKRKPPRKAVSKAARKAPRAPGRRPKASAPAPQPAPPANGDYTAHDIEILEGLEPVRRRPGMYVGGTDQRALHHLLAELIDNAMDEAIAGHASRIEIALHGDGAASVKDNGRGIPVDPHPKYENVSALQVILTTLHSGGKFGDKVYATSGGLHGVGLSVVNALSEQLTVEVARDKRLWRQSYARGTPAGPLEDAGPVTNRRGTLVRFHPDPEIFGEGVRFGPRALYEMARTRAYLYRGVEIRWSCEAALLADAGTVPETAVLHYPGGLVDYLNATLGKRHTLTPAPFAGQGALNGDSGRVEWAVAWPEDEDGFVASHCNTVPTSQGGSHESGMRGALVRGLKSYGALVGNKRAAQLTADDVTGGACALLSVFLRDPQFQGQTKERLASPEAGRLVENALGDHFDHWLSADPSAANLLLERVVERAEERLRRRKDREVARKRAARKTRLPGKLADCAREAAAGTEIFLVEGDSAGGSAKQARNRETQAVLPLRGKILNVASASADKLRGNKELDDLVQALGCGTGARFDAGALRYERVVIMTDADVDGAHIAALLMTFFYRQMPGLIDAGHLFLAQPPLYRLARGGTTRYARDDADRVRLLESDFSGAGKVEISRFKGLGEMPPAQLKETTMDPARRTLLRVEVAEDAVTATARRVEELMGRRPESRLAFIQTHADRVTALDL